MLLLVTVFSWLVQVLVRHFLTDVLLLSCRKVWKL